MDLAELSSKYNVGADYFDAKFEEIAEEIKELQWQIGKCQEQVMFVQNAQARIYELL
jgi:site-specific DNA recombinase